MMFRVGHSLNPSEVHVLCAGRGQLAVKNLDLSPLLLGMMCMVPGILPIRPWRLRAVPGSLASRSGACGETAQHEADHRETHEGSRLSGVALVVTCKPTTTADPRQCSFDNPSVREHHEAMPVTAADDLEHPRAGPRDR